MIHRENRTNFFRKPGKSKNTSCTVFSFACFITYDKSGKHVKGRISVR
jgi:hypothetical protein